MLEMTIGYVGERKQFGVPIGTFQAVKHHLANAGLEVQFAEPLVRHAAHLLADGHSAADVRTAPGTGGRFDGQGPRIDCRGVRSPRSPFNATERSATRVEHDLHLFMKRAWALARSRGTADWHLRRVRTALIGRS